VTKQHAIVPIPLRKCENRPGAALRRNCEIARARRRG
jgi:hypothetical protein